MENFLEVYRSLNRDNLKLLSTIYAEDVVFTDPAHEISGIDQLQRYFENLYRNIHSASFSFHHNLRSGDHAYLRWTMDFSHPRLAGGKNISLPGVSSLQFNKDDRVFRHHDFFDMGAMIYEHLPLLGGVIKTIKKRLGT